MIPLPCVCRIMLQPDKAQQLQPPVNVPLTKQQLKFITVTHKGV